MASQQNQELIAVNLAEQLSGFILISALLAVGAGFRHALPVTRHRGLAR
jgi:hypothetical protein